MGTPSPRGPPFIPCFAANLVLTSTVTRLSWAHWAAILIYLSGVASQLTEEREVSADDSIVKRLSWARLDCCMDFHISNTRGNADGIRGCIAPPQSWYPEAC